MGHPTMCHDDNRQQLAERYLFGGMRRREMRAYEEHVAQCAACQEQLRQGRQMLAELKTAAKNAGWSRKEIDNLSRLYARRGPFAQINWRLVLAITAVLCAVFVLPFIWWANRPETRMRLLVSLQPESVDVAQLPEPLQEPVRLHQLGRQEQVIQRLMPLSTDSRYRAFWPAIQRLIGLAYLLEKQPERAIPHLQRSLADTSASGTERAAWYLANAYLLIADRPVAERFLEAVVAKNGEFKEKAGFVLEQLQKIE